MAFSKNVFINCPFDNTYKRLLHPIIFTIIYSGLEPKISKLEDSGSIRLKQIIKLIKESKYSIHDLSRMKSKKSGELARFNMPFELGLDLGTRGIGTSQLKKKKCLILDVERYRYQAAISDMSGSDIASYGKRNQVEKIIEKIRDWFTTVLNPIQPASSMLYLEYSEFISDLQIELEELSFNKDDIKKLTNSEYIHYTKKWISNRKKSSI